MTVEVVGFWVVALVLLVSSLAVVLSANLFHAVLWLAASLIATGGVFLLLDAPFLFGVQLLLYAGGVVTIVVFAIMLTERLVGQTLGQATRNVVNGAVVALAVLIGVLGSLVEAPPPARPVWTLDTTTAIGRALVGALAAPFELLAVLLVVALLGALYFARTDDS